MTQAMKKEIKEECQSDVFGALRSLLLNLVVLWYSSSMDWLDINLSREELALLAIGMFMKMTDTVNIIVCWALWPTIFFWKYREYAGTPKPSTTQDSTTNNP